MGNESVEFVGFVELKTCPEPRKGELALTSDTGSNATNGLTTLSNIEPLLRWIPAPALDPDPGSAGMTMLALAPDPGYAVIPDLIRHPEIRKRGRFFLLSWLKTSQALFSDQTVYVFLCCL